MNLKKKIFNLYINKLLTGPQVAKLCKISNSTVYRILHSMNGIIRTNVYYMIGQCGEKSRSWKGGKFIDNRGYINICIPGNHSKREHIIIAEKILERSLKENETVHHINGNKSDNRNCNLLICDRSYHVRLHSKMSDLYMKDHFGDK